MQSRNSSRSESYSKNSDDTEEIKISHKKGEFALCTEDGLANRELYLNSDKKRWKAFLARKIKNNSGIETIPEMMCTTRLSNSTYTWRIFLNCITLGGIISSLVSVLWDKFSIVFALIFTGLLMNFSTLISNIWDINPDDNLPNLHWTGNMIVLACCSVIILLGNSVLWTYETRCFSRGQLLRRLRRARFNQIQAKQRLLDPYSRDFSQWYNDEKDDPDVAICVFRNSTSLDALWWFEAPNNMSLVKPNYIINK